MKMHISYVHFHPIFPFIFFILKQLWKIKEIEIY